MNQDDSNVKEQHLSDNEKVIGKKKNNKKKKFDRVGANSK